MKRTLLAVAFVVSFVATAFAATPPTPRTPIPPTPQTITHAPNLNFREAAEREKQNGVQQHDEIEEVAAPGPPPDLRKGVTIQQNSVGKGRTFALPATGNGPSPGPIKTFKAEFISVPTIPPDTMGAVGTTHIVTVTNDRMRIQTRDGVEISRMTLTSFWAGVLIKGQPFSAFDPKIIFDRFNSRWILISSGNGIGVNSGAGFAVSATADPTGTWYRWSVPADPASTGIPGGSGHWIDYPSVGFNKNWIVVDENVFSYTCNTTTCSSGSLFGTQIYVLDKQAAYANTLASISLFQDSVANCTAPFESKLACGFTMAPAITEDNTTDTVYMLEDWDNIAGQLRLSKITGTPAAPSITIGTQFPQSTHSWAFNAQRLSVSGGYIPQRQQSANLPSSQRIMANDSRVQNSVLRNGKLWCAHTIMVATTPTLAGTGFGAGNPDNHSGIQWWQIDPTNETLASTPPLQRGRIEDPTATNCHNGTAGTSAVAPCTGNTSFQTGEFFAFPNISVNQNEDVFIGFTRASPITYANSGYVIRRATDPPNTVRDPVIFRPGQANYNLGAGAGNTTARQNRWGDYSAAQTDPLNDTDFWTVQEYAGSVRDYGIGPAGPWETWWAQVRPTTPVAAPGNGLIISELRLRGPQGTRDEFVKLYNPNATPVIVNTADNSEGWALVYSNNGTTVTQVFAVIPNGTVIPPHGHFLVADNPDAAALPTTVYSLNGNPSVEARGADSDFGWSLDLADNGGVALFKTAITANFIAANRLDSAGFSTIAAGLFKEGAGIPAVTAATPTGQMTFYRDLSSGTPKDTGANENDFIFANTVVGETLGSTPRLGAAGPANLDSPIHDTGATTLPNVQLDAGIGAGSPPNRFRDATVVANGAFGTIAFRRTFTNNTGAPIQRLRFRVIDMTTNPPVGPNADLRVLTSSSTVVTLSGGGPANVAGSTLETPPAQAAGGGLNGTLGISTITNVAPLPAAGSVNLQFTVGVQVTGNFNFCLVPETFPVSSSASLCFAGTTENTAPSLTPGGPLARTAGVAASNSTIATVSDAQDAASALVVTVQSAPAGITVSNIVNGAGTVTADVAAGPAVVGGSYNVILRVDDTQGATTTGTLVVNVTPATPTATPGGPTTFCTPGSVLLTSSAAAGNQWNLNGNPINLETNQTYSATGSGSYTVTVTEGGFTSLPSNAVVVTANTPPNAPTNTPGGPTTFCADSNVTLTSSAPSGNQWYLGINPIVGATGQQYVANQSGSYTVKTTDGNNCTSAASNAVVLTVNPLPNAPTNTPGGPTTFCAGGSVTLTSSAGSGNQWYLGVNPIGGATGQQYVANASGSYTVKTTDGNSCTSAASAATVVTVNPLPTTPTITPGGPTTFCAGGSVTLTSSASSGNQWSLNGNPIGGATGQQYIANASGSYTVKTTDGNSCTSAASAATVVTVNPLPATPTITPGGPTTFCAGGSVTLTSSASSGNQWFLNGNPIGGATGQQYIANASGSYTVKTTDGNSCTSAASAATVVTVNPNPNATITAPASAPSGTTGNIASVANAGAGATYVWGITNGTITAGAGTPSITFTAGAIGTLTLNVTVTTSANCSDTKSANVTVTPPLVTITSVVPNNGPYFGGVPVTVNGSGFQSGATLTFGGSAATNVVVVNPTKITAKTPAHAGGAVNVTVTNPDTGTFTAVNAYTYQPRHFDANGDNTVDPSDIFYLIAYLYMNGPAPHGSAGLMSGDANGDGLIDPSDIFYLVNFLFGNGQQPFETQPGRATTSSSDDARVAGSIALGRAVRRGDSLFVPVTVTRAPGSAMPRALSLNLRIDNADGVAIHRAGAAQPMFEASNGTYYIVSYDKFAIDGSVVAEIEIPIRDRAMRIDIDPKLSMLSDQTGTHNATVANGALRVTGTTVNSPSEKPEREK